MELRKLVDKCWDLVEQGKVDGDELPNLDLCEQEFQILLMAYCEKKLREETK